MEDLECRAGVYAICFIRHGFGKKKYGGKENESVL